jgi:hypothetical protein
MNPEQYKPTFPQGSVVDAGQGAQVSTGAGFNPLQPQTAVPTPTTPSPAPTTDISVTPSPQIDTNLLTGTPQTLLDVQGLITANAKLRDKYIERLAPSQQEVGLQNEISTLRKSFDDFQLSLAQGQKEQFGLGRPLELSTGRAQQMEDNASLKKLSFTSQEKNLLSRLGLAQEMRKAELDSTGAALKFGAEDIDMTLKVQQAIQQQQQLVLDRATKLSDQARNTLALTLQQFKGLDYTELDPASQSQLVSVAGRAGIPVDVLIQGMKTVKDQILFENSTRAADTIVDPLTGNIFRIDKLTGAITPLTQNGQPTTQSTRGNPAQINNNPGNIKSTSTTLNLFKDLGVAASSTQATDGGNFLKFPSQQAGFTAIERLLGTSIYNNLTVDAAMRKWSSNGYNGAIAPALANKKVSALTSSEKQTLIQAMAKQEGFYAKAGGVTESTENPAIVNWAAKVQNGEAELTNVPEKYRTPVVSYMEQNGLTIVPRKARDTIAALGQAGGIVDQLKTLATELNPQFAKTPAQRVTKGGRLAVGAFLQSNQKAVEINRFKEGILSTLSRATGERGVLTDQDIARARNLLPRLTDTAQTVEGNLKQLDILFNEFRNRALETYTTPNAGLNTQSNDPLGIRR